MIRLTIPAVGAEELAEIEEVLRTGFLTTGPKVAEFEQMVAEWVGVKHAIAVSSGTAALHLALVALGVGHADEVLVPDLTFPATANAVLLAGARPVLCDIDPVTYCIDPVAAERLITPWTRVIMPVHQFGLAADMDSIMELARARRLAVVEDAAPALGATYGGRQVGTFGDLACFSLHPRKIITTGEGGVLTTNRDDLADRVRQLRNHGMMRRDGAVDFVEAGYNYRLSDIQAAVGVAQMRKLPALMADRRRVAAAYAEALSGAPGVQVPGDPPGRMHTYQSYVVRVSAEARDGALQALRAAGVECIFGTYAVHAQSTYQALGHRLGDLPGALAAMQETISLPIYIGLHEEQVAHIAGVLRNALVR